MQKLGRSPPQTSEPKDEHNESSSEIEISGETYTIGNPVRAMSLITQLDAQDSRLSSQISERLDIYHDMDGEDEGGAWGPAWGPARRRASGSSSGPSESNSGSSTDFFGPFGASERKAGSSRVRFGPSDLGRIVGKYTVSDEHGRSKSSPVYEDDTGDLVLDTGESIVRARSIGAGQRRIVEKATPELSAKQREELIQEIWEPGMKDGRLLARTLRAYDALVRDRHVVSDAGR